MQKMCLKFEQFLSQIVWRYYFPGNVHPHVNFIVVIFIPSQLEKTERGKNRGKKTIEENGIGAINITVVSCIGHLGEGDPNLKLYFAVGDNDFPFKRIFELWVPRCPPSFCWNDIYVADGTNSLACFVVVGSL